MTDHKNQFEICVRAIIRSGNKILVCVGKKNGIYFFRADTLNTEKRPPPLWKEN